jgi:hypothetical protein
MGFEAMANGGDSEGNPQSGEAGAAKSAVDRCPPVPADADLAAVVEAWPVLPEPIRAGILAMVKAVKR